MGGSIQVGIWRDARVWVLENNNFPRLHDCNKNVDGSFWKKVASERVLNPNADDFAQNTLSLVNHPVVSWSVAPMRKMTILMQIAAHLSHLPGRPSCRWWLQTATSTRLCIVLIQSCVQISNGLGHLFRTTPSPQFCRSLVIPNHDSSFPRLFFALPYILATFQ